MSHQFNPGDPALVIAGTLLGESVEVLHWVEPGGELKGSDGRILRLSKRSGGYLVQGRDARVVKHGFNLMPLRGDFAPEQHKAREAEPCA